ncbi:uncharacterized protein LOC130978967 [Arachis stenosperma]|uniref:uncharacterized protein LOC130978967 n=1 Tax=Arachis stenosperma TaxID=217475 RepID=UPI0025AC3355|nr:uncharacterized protein LOC130978967 [Arachis stenosperma]
MTHSSDVLGLGNKASGSKKRSLPSDSEDDNERELQMKMKMILEVFSDCDAQVLHLMNTGVLFVLLVTSGPPTPGQTAQMNETRALIGGGTEYVVMDSTPYPNFHAEIGVHRDPPYIVLLREMDALHTFPPHALPQEIADRVAENAD